MEESHFHVQLTAILDVLMKTAVSDICALADSWVRSFQEEIRREQQENQSLRHKLHFLEQQQPHMGKKDSGAGEAAAGGEQRPDSKKMMENSETESATSKRGQWCVMLHKWNSAPGAKVEAMDRSISETEEEKQDAISGDAVCLVTEVNQAVYELKTESETAVPGLQKSECSPDVNADCEDEHEETAVQDDENERESTQHFPQPKREEEEEFDISCLLTPDLQFHSTHQREHHSESTNPDCSMPLNLNHDFGLGVTAPNAKHFVGRGSISRKHEKRTGSFICNICGKTLTTKRSFICHLRLHTGEKPFTCTQCGKRFAKKFNLDIHYNVHSGARPYACTLCPRSFADPSAFGRHKIMHRKKSQPDAYNPKYKFICNVCGQSFLSKSSLVVHSKLHTTEKHNVEKVLLRNVF